MSVDMNAKYNFTNIPYLFGTRSKSIRDQNPSD